MVSTALRSLWFLLSILLWSLKCTSHFFLQFSCDMTSFPSCPSLDYLTCSSHYTFPILHLIILLKHAHLITQSLHISLHDSIFVFHCHFISASYYTETKFPLYLTYFENLYTLLSFFMHLIIMFLLYVTSSLHFLFTHLISAWRMPIFQDTSWDIAH